MPEAVSAPEPTDSAALTVSGLCKTFRPRRGPAVEALKGVSFVVRRGGVTGLVGPDGAGKSTLLRIAVGLLPPTAGRVNALGDDCVRDALRIQSRVGYMPQKFGLYQELSVQENLDLFADLQGVPKAVRSERFARLLTMTGLGAFTRRRAGNLSGGMKQKLGLACALIKSPELLLLDEPTVGVDPISRRELWRIVNAMVAKENIGVLLATAYLDETERCRWVVVLQAGAKLAEGPPPKFKEQLQGRVFLVHPPPQVKPRQIQTRLVGQRGIVDATIRSGKVRVVTKEAGPGALGQHLPAFLQTRIAPVSPSFEDAFMVLAAAETEGGRPAPITHIHSDRSGVGDSVVAVRDLRKSFGEFEAVKGLSFEVHRGEIFGLLGPNGAGKSTTFQMLCGLLSVSAGEVRVAGANLRRARAKARRRLGYMAQHFSLYAQMTVRENLQFFGRAYGLWGAHLARRLKWAEDEFGLGPRRNEASGGLPGGFKQRLALAAALLHEPEILFLDEPTSGVDPLARREFWLRINGFAEQGVTVVVTTHFMEEAEYCDRMLIMSQGETLALGTPGEIRAAVRSAANSEPTIEEAFIALAEGRLADADGAPDAGGPS